MFLIAQYKVRKGLNERRSILLGKTLLIGLLFVSISKGALLTYRLDRSPVLMLISAQNLRK
jgi:hypothetical protein